MVGNHMNLIAVVAGVLAVAAGAVCWLLGSVPEGGGGAEYGAEWAES